jgi:hypothetical protein
MATNLESVLEPLLTRLWEAAERLSNPMDATSASPVAVEAARRSVIDDILSLQARFRRYYVLDHYDLEPLGDLLHNPVSDTWESPMGDSVYCHVAVAHEKVQQVANLIVYGDWLGHAAQTFHTNALDGFKTTAGVHALCARELALTANALAGAVERIKTRVIWICQYGLWGMGAGDYPGLPPGSEGGGEGKAEPPYKKFGGILAVLADAVAFFLAVSEPELGVLEVVLASAGFGGGLVAEWQNSSMPDDPIIFDADPHVLRILPNMAGALNAIDRNIAELDEQASHGLDGDLDQYGVFQSSYGYIGGSGRGGEPELTPSDYTHLNMGPLPSDATKVQQIMTDPDVTPDGIVVNHVKLYYAGYVTMPVAADAYAKCVKVCTAVDVRAIQEMFPKTVGKFDEAMDRFSYMLTRTRDHLISYGPAMVSAAENYEGLDTYHAQMIQLCIDRIPSPLQSLGHDYYTPPKWLMDTPHPTPKPSHSSGLGIAPG